MRYIPKFIYFKKDAKNAKRRQPYVTFTLKRVKRLRLNVSTFLGRVSACWGSVGGRLAVTGGVRAGQLAARVRALCIKILMSSGTF